MNPFSSLPDEAVQCLLYGVEGNLAVQHRRLIGERCHDDNRLADVLFIQTLYRIHVRVVCADVIVHVPSKPQQITANNSIRGWKSVLQNRWA